jgi:hypothetical protein
MNQRNMGLHRVQRSRVPTSIGHNIVSVGSTHLK